MNDQNKKVERNYRRLVFLCIVIIITCVIVNKYVERWQYNKVQIAEHVKQEEKIVTDAYIKKILGTDKLITYECIYNGICEINPKTDPKNSYYCSYKSKIYTGIDFSMIAVSVDENRIEITVPKIRIFDYIVEVSSLDYMNVTKKMNTKNIVQLSYNACVKDAINTIKGDQEVIKLAKENTYNVIRAMIIPFIEGSDYEIIFLEEREVTKS